MNQFYIELKFYIILNIMKKRVNKNVNKNVIINVIMILLFVSFGFVGFGIYTYKTLESHVDYSSCVSYIPYLDTSIKHN